MQTYQIPDRFPPIHYWPNEYFIVKHSVTLRKLFLAKLFYTNIKGCYVCHSDCECVHHIIPISDLGNNQNKNLVPLCFKHHQEIHNGFIDSIKTPVGINNALIKKTRKLMRKLWTKNSNSLRLNQDQDFIELHLMINDTIKYLIQYNLFDRLSEYINRLYNNGTIKSRPKY